MDEHGAGDDRRPTTDERAADARRTLVAGGLIFLGLLATLGGDGAAFVVAGVGGHGPDWGLIIAVGVFGLLFAAFGECLAHDPTPRVRTEVPVITSTEPEAPRRGERPW